MKLNKMICFLFMTVPLWASFDVAVTSVQRPSEIPPPPDGSISVHFRIQNNGDPVTVVVKGYSNRDRNCSNGLREEYVRTFTMARGQSVSDSYFIYSRPGDTTIYAVVKADPDNHVPETNENNNCLASTAITVLLPDLRVIATEGPTPARIIAGGAATQFGVAVGNFSPVGNSGWPSDPTNMYYYLSDQTTNPPNSDRIDLVRPIPALSPDESQTISAELSVPEDFPLGTYHLFAKADGSNLVQESNESNNFSAQRTVEVVDFCTAADGNGNGYVDILDLIPFINTTGVLVNESNQHLNLVGSPKPFPEIINRGDFLEAIVCWAPPLDLEGGTLFDFEVYALRSGGFRLMPELSGVVGSISALIKMPSGETLDLISAKDPLRTGVTSNQILAEGEYLVTNDHAGTNYDGTTLNGSFTLAQLGSSLDLTDLETITDPALFHSGIAVTVTFADRSQAVVMKRFPFFEVPDPAFRGYLEGLYGLAPGERLRFSQVMPTYFLNLDGLGIQDITGIEAFTGLVTLSLSDNPVTTVPDLTRLTKLKYLVAFRNQIQSMGAMPASLLWLTAPYNEMTRLPDLSRCSGLLYINVSKNQLTRLPDLSPFQSLEALFFDDNQVTSVPELPASVTKLVATNNLLSKLPDLSGHTIELLDVGRNNLYDLDTLMNVTWAPDAIVYINENSLDISDCDLLQSLVSNITELYYLPQAGDVSDCFAP